MRRIIASLFVVVAITGAGVLATGAYFQASTQVNNVTLTAGSANIGLGACLGSGCTITNFDASAEGTVDASVLSLPAVGPGMDTIFCLAVAAEGGYPLTLTQTISGIDNGPLAAALRLKVMPADGACHDTAPALADNTLDQWNNYVLTLATNSPVGTKVFVLEELSWDPTANAGNQNALQGQSLHLNATISGRTL